MDSGLCLEIAVGPFAIDLESRALDARAVTGLKVGEVRRITVPFRPAQVEP